MSALADDDRAPRTPLTLREGCAHTHASRLASMRERLELALISGQDARASALADRILEHVGR